MRWAREGRTERTSWKSPRRVITPRLLITRRVLPTGLFSRSRPPSLASYLVLPSLHLIFLVVHRLPFFFPSSFTFLGHLCDEPSPRDYCKSRSRFARDALSAGDSACPTCRELQLLARRNRYAGRRVGTRIEDVMTLTFLG